MRLSKNGYKKLSTACKGLGMDLDDVKCNLFKSFKGLVHEEGSKWLDLHLVSTKKEKKEEKIEAESKEGRGSWFNVYLNI